MSDLHEIGRGPKLEGWDDIAGHFRVNKRTAQNWATNRSLPIFRSPTGRVYAFEEDLNEWQSKHDIPPPALALNSAPLSTPSAAPERELQTIGVSVFRGLWLRVLLTALAAAIVLAAGIGLALFLSGRGMAPSAFRLEGNSLIVEDAKGKQIWRHDFPEGFWSSYYGSSATSELAWFGDLDGDGRTEMLFLYHQAIEPRSHSSTLICYSNHGEEKWRWRPGRVLPELGSTPSTWVAVGLAVLNGSPRRIVVSSRHDPYYPDQVALLNAHGKTVSEYWHSGNLNLLALMDSGHGRQNILLGGISNGYRQATLVVLDPDAVKGASMEAARPELQIHGFGDAQERKRLLFPRSCINRANERYNEVVGLTATTAGVRVAVRESLNWPSFQVWYEFDGSLRLVSATPDDRFVAMHQTLFSQGLIDHPFGKPEEQAFQQIRCLSGCE